MQGQWIPPIIRRSLHTHFILMRPHLEETTLLTQVVEGVPRPDRVSHTSTPRLTPFEAKVAVVR